MIGGSIKRRVCSPRHFEVYFRFALSSDVLSRSEVEELIARSDDSEFVQRSFLDAVKISSPGFATKAALLLEELSIHAGDVPQGTVGNVLASIYSVADDLVGQKEREQGGATVEDGPTIVFLWRLTQQLTLTRFLLEDRSEILLKACEGATLGWLVEFTRRTYLNHFPPKNMASESAENCLTTCDDALKLKGYTVECIREAAQNGSLRDCPSLYNVLNCWVIFVGNKEEARSWAGAVIREDDVEVARLAKAFTGVSSTGVLGDSIVRKSPTAITGQLESFCDLGEFRSRAEQVEREGKLSAEDHEALVTFLNAWRKQEAEKTLAPTSQEPVDT